MPKDAHFLVHFEFLVVHVMNVTIVKQHVQNHDALNVLLE